MCDTKRMEGVDCAHNLVIDLDSDDDAVVIGGALGKEMVVIDDSSNEGEMDNAMHFETEVVILEEEEPSTACSTIKKTSLEEEEESVYIIVQEFKALIEAAVTKLGYSLQRLKVLASECKGLSFVDEKEMDCDLHVLLNIIYEIREWSPDIFTPGSIRDMDEIMQLLSSANHLGEKLLADNIDDMKSGRVVSKKHKDEVPSTTASTDIFPVRTPSGQRKRIFPVRGPSGQTKLKAAAADLSGVKDLTEKRQKDEISNTTLLSHTYHVDLLNRDKSVGIPKQGHKESSEKRLDDKIITSSGLNGAVEQNSLKNAGPTQTRVTDPCHNSPIIIAQNSPLLGSEPGKSRGSIQLDSSNQIACTDVDNTEKATSELASHNVPSNSDKISQSHENVDEIPTIKDSDDQSNAATCTHIIAQKGHMLGFEPGKASRNIQLDSSNPFTCPYVDNTEQATAESTPHNVPSERKEYFQRLENVDKIPTIKDTDDQSNAAACTNNREGASYLAAPWGDLEHLPDGLNPQKVSMKEEMERQVEQYKLFAVRKLSLVLDLDHTLLDSVMCEDVEPSLEKKLRKREENDRNDAHRYLFHLQNMKMWTKLRPGVWNFLMEASKLYELYIYTMGTKSYATEMAKLLDPTGDLFAGRVIARGEDARCFGCKDLDGILGVESAVVIIDDNARVWPQHMQNLINPERYMYFPCSRRKFGALGLSLLERRCDEATSDGALASLLVVIERIHSEFFSHSNLHEADVRKILVSLKHKVLAGCKILCSGIIPVEEKKPHNHPIWRTAKRFGAVCTNHFDDQVTHVLAKAAGIEEVNWAHKNNKIVVRPSWVDASAFLYRRVDERRHPLTS